MRNGIEPVLARAKAYAPYSDLIWVETGTPDLGLAREFATELHREFPGKKLAYNCSPSFNWRAALSDNEIASFQDELGDLGYAFQFITLAGFHALNHSMFHLANGYARTGMTAYVELQEAEFASEAAGYTAIKHQAEVGTGYFDKVSTAINPTTRNPGPGRLDRSRSSSTDPLRFPTQKGHDMTSTIARTPTVRGPEIPRGDEILTPEALAFVAALDGAFAGRRADLLAERRSRAKRISAGETPGFLGDIPFRPQRQHLAGGDPGVLGWSSGGSRSPGRPPAR